VSSQDSESGACPSVKGAGGQKSCLGFLRFVYAYPWPASASPTPIRVVSNLVLCQGEALEIRMAYKDETPISAILTIRLKRRSTINMDVSMRGLISSGHLLALLNAIVAAKTRNATKLDFGRTEEDNPGLLCVQESWAPRPQSLIYWRYRIGSSFVSVTGWKLKMAKRVFSCLPQ